MKKKFMNIRPQEVTENGERSLQYKGSDGKMHGISAAGNGGDAAQSKSYAIVNNPDAYLIVPGTEYTYNGQLLYKAVTCDDAQTEISASELAEILKNDPNTTVIYRAIPDGRSNEETAILRTVQFDNALTTVSLEGALAGNKLTKVQCYVYSTENQIKVFTSLVS